MDSLDIDNEYHLRVNLALAAFMEKRGFDDFRYSIVQTFSGEVTCFELYLIDKQDRSQLSIRVKTYRHAYDDYDLEVETDGETYPVEKFDVNSIVEVIEKSLAAYLVSKNDFLKNISKGFLQK